MSLAILCSYNIKISIYVGLGNGSDFFLRIAILSSYEVATESLKKSSLTK